MQHYVVGSCFAPSTNQQFQRPHCTVRPIIACNCGKVEVFYSGLGSQLPSRLLIL